MIIITRETRDFDILDIQKKEKVTVNCKHINNKGWDWQGLCPFHNDHIASLFINLKLGLLGLYKCHGCGRTGPLWDSNYNNKNRYISHIYSYRNSKKELIHQVVRFEPKRFAQRRPDPDRPGKFIWNLKGVEPVLYNLPEVLANPDKTLFIPEGEKNCDNLAKIGLLATTNSGGAGSWKPEYNQCLKGRTAPVILLPDKDEAGEKRVQDIAQSLIGAVKVIKIVDLPGLSEGEDVSNWLENMKAIDAGGRKLTNEEITEELKSYIDDTPEFISPPRGEEKKEPFLKPKDTPYIEKEIEEVSQKKLDGLLEKAIPDHGFLRDYIDAFSEVTDTPKAFLFWGAMTLISTVLGKGVWIDWEARELYPNIWCVFLAPSGFRKGTGIDLSVKLIWDFNSDLLLPSIGSEEGFTKILDIKKGGHNVGFIRWQEFVKILKGWNIKGSWIANQEFFIDIFDSKTFKKTLSREEFYVGETAVSFLAGCTPSGFSNYFRREDLEGGFFGRVYLIVCKEKEKYFVIPPAMSKSIFNDLLLKLKKIDEGKFSGAISYENIRDDFEAWGHWMQDHREKGFMVSFYSRIEVHCMKLMLIYQASLDQQNTKLGKEALNYAINAINFLLASARLMVSEEIGLSEQQRQTLRIRNYIRSRKTASRREVYRAFHLSKKDMTEIENTLVEAGYIYADTNYRSMIYTAI